MLLAVGVTPFTLEEVRQLNPFAVEYRYDDELGSVLSADELVDLVERETILYLTPLHGKLGALKKMIANIGAALQYVKKSAEQLNSIDRWAFLIRYVSDHIAPSIDPPRPPQTAAEAG